MNDDLTEILVSNCKVKSKHGIIGSQWAEYDRLSLIKKLHSYIQLG